ncbi:glycosyltransferase [Cytobacillus firmus]|uniref:Spore protein YkvP/CgeB glycosyl transferase-like domain-containing protein n=1 Tax=Cytobacillus firmus TaxID=1399 RepID=A0A800MTT9_CYTFI|nr:glycosyltransferase [Cytobacillus firmus]KAF0822378.1 hypothetical protein KIS1582_3866 [Cytobacillus firmus]
MNILFVTSGYTGIYCYFENWVIRIFEKKHKVKIFKPHYSLFHLQSIVKSCKPDVVISLLGLKFSTKKLEWLRKQGIKTAVWFTEDPYFMDYTELLSNFYDYIFTIDSAALEFYKKKGHDRTFHLPLAAEPSVFSNRLVVNEYISDICLLGFPYPDRIKYIELLLEHTPYKIKVVGKWNHLLSLSKFRNHINLSIKEGWVEPSIAANFYNGAKIVLNTHRPFNLKQNKNSIGIVGKSINNRTFDVAASGAFQLIQFKEDLPAHFIEEDEIIAFKNESELIKKVEYYMQLEEDRQRIANNARIRVLEEHTFEHRIKRMMSILDES